VNPLKDSEIARLILMNMKRSRALLINPWIYDFKAYDLWLKPLGLLTVAAMLIREGYDITYLDCLDRFHWSLRGLAKAENRHFGCGSYYSTEMKKPTIYQGLPRKYKRYGIPVEGLISDLRRVPEPDVILVTTLMTYWYPGALYALELLKERFPRTPVLLGGIYARLCSDHASTNCSADVIVSHADPEKTLNMLSDITGQRRANHYRSFDDYPLPALHLLNQPQYLPYLTSLGCQYRCSYCASGTLFPHYQSKKPEKLSIELKFLYDSFQIRDIALFDDSLLFRFNWHLKELLTMLHNDSISLRFHTPNALHGRYITPSAAELLKSSGFKTIRLGFEFSSSSLQQSTGNKVTSEEMGRAVSHLHRAGFSSRDIGLYVMTGIPCLSHEEVKAALEMCFKWNVQSRIVELSPFPGIPLWNLFPGSSSAEAADPLFHNNTFHTYRSSTMPFEAWQELKALSTRLNRSLRD